MKRWLSSVNPAVVNLSARYRLWGWYHHHRGKIVDGSITFKGRELVGLSEKEYRKVRGNEISMIFQEPMTALNPVLKISTQMIDVIRLHNDVSKKQARARAIEMLDTVGIPSPEKRIDQYPHELSGGMRKR